LTEAGRIAIKCWQAIPEHFPNVEARELAVMPDHVHGLVRMVGAKNLSPILPEERPRGTSRTLGSVVRGFKVGVTKWVRKNTGIQDVWHRNYYEMIVRTPEAAKKIAEYIRVNPWKLVQHGMHQGRRFRMIGNPALLHHEKIAMLCSRNCPPDVLATAEQRACNAGPDCCVLSGFHSPPEKAILTALLRTGEKSFAPDAPKLICCPAWGIDEMRIPPEWLPALEANRMLILEMRNSDGDLAAAEARNRFVLQHADQLWLPHITPGGMLDRLVRARKGEKSFAPTAPAAPTAPNRKLTS
jgi:REP element-mobilizing transposase RayT